MLKLDPERNRTDPAFSVPGLLPGASSPDRSIAPPILPAPPSRAPAATLTPPASAPFIHSAPPLTLVPPVYALVPLNVRFPSPCLVNPPTPPNGCAIVTLFPLVS